MRILFPRWPGIHPSKAREMGWCIYQMDLKTTFLNGVIDEEVHVEKP
jgi:hypothetical protein